MGIAQGGLEIRAQHFAFCVMYLLSKDCYHIIG